MALTNTSVRGLILATLLLASAASSARAVSITLLGSDAEFLTEFPAAEWTKKYGANVRWGNNAANGDWEAAIVTGADVPYAGAQRQGQVSGTRLFSFNYDSALGQGTLSLTGFADAVTSLDGTGVNTVMIRARAATGRTAALQGLALQLGTSTLFLGDLIGDSDAQYIVLQDAGFSSDWSITAFGTLASDAAQGSNPMYQLKVGVAPVPDAGATASALGFVLVVLAALARRR